MCLDLGSCDFRVEIGHKYYESWRGDDVAKLLGAGDKLGDCL